MHVIMPTEEERNCSGYCSHIAAIVYYLAHARYLSKLLKPAEILSKMFQQDDITPVIEENSDED